MRNRLLVPLIAALLPVSAMAVPVPVDVYLARDAFTDVRISPTGEYMAATVPFEDRTSLAIVRLSDSAVTGRFNPPQNNHVVDFSWVNNDRVLISLGEKFGRLETPMPTGELYSTSASGGLGDLLVGYRVQAMEVGSRIQRKTAEMVAAFVIDSRHDDPNNVLIRTFPFDEEPVTRVERMDVRSGKRTVVARAPVRRAEFVSDPSGEVRFALGASRDNASKLYYRADRNAEWQQINDELVSGQLVTPLGLNQAGTVAYLQVSQPQGPDAVMAWDIASNQRTQVARHAVGDPVAVIHRPGTRIVVGVEVALPSPQSLFFDEQSDEARRHRNLEKAFGGAVQVTSSSSDGSKLMVRTWSDRNPGDYYLVDTVTQKAQHIVSRAPQIDPEGMAATRVISLTARDGLPLHGYLTTPNGSDSGKRLPMVVLPHGGPYGVHDNLDFDVDRQMLAAAGYAVLQVNYRGSGGLGRSHRQAGARQWGGTMQDDLSDATRWAIAEGVADAGKVCIYGASYGAYAALMGAAKDKGLYRCAAGYVGVYDLPVMQRESAREARWMGNWSREWVGDDEQALAASSPNRIAGQITVPVFLAAGGEDKVAPVRHTEMMEAALRRAGVPVSTLYYPTEGHGFYKPEHQKAYYTQLLAFLADHLGGERAAP